MLAAAYHVVGAARGLPEDLTPVSRHLLFVVIDCVVAWYLLRRPLWRLPCFGVLVAQQFMSHGEQAARWWRDSRHLDVLSILTLPTLTATLILLTLDARDRSHVVRRLVCPFGRPASPT